jgi:hypothetical protein
MITIEEQQEALRPVFEDVTGITEYLEDFPDALQPQQLPCLITVAGEATYDQETYGADSLLIRRRWEAVLLIKLRDPTREFQSEQDVKPFLTSIPLALAAHPVITLEDGRGFEVKLHQGGDRGARGVRINNNPYTGSVFSFFTIVEDTVDPVDAL